MANGLVVTLRVTDELNKLISSLEAFSEEEIKKVIVSTLNESAVEAKKAIRTEMQRVFDRPTPYTLNSLYVFWAKPNRLEATVEFKDEGKGTPAKYFLTPEVEGGERNMKGSEKLLQAIGLGKNIYIAPGPGARLDAYGNVPGSKYVQVLSYLRLMRDSGVTSNRSGKKRRSVKQEKYLLVSPIDAQGKTTHLSPGIYEREGPRLNKIFNFISKPHYTKRLDFYGLGLKVAADVFRTKFEQAVIKALYSRQGSISYAPRTSAPIQGPFES